MQQTRPSHDINVNGSNLLVNRVQRSLVRALRAVAGVVIQDEHTIGRNDARRIAVVHELQFPQNLLSH